MTISALLFSFITFSSFIAHLDNSKITINQFIGKLISNRIRHPHKKLSILLIGFMKTPHQFCHIYDKGKCVKIIFTLISYPRTNHLSLRKIQKKYEAQLDEIFIGSGFQPNNAFIIFRCFSPGKKRNSH